MVVAVVIRSRVSNKPERHLHDTAATGAACVDMREAVLLQLPMVGVSVAISQAANPD
jgi:hypothetical protein